MSNASDEREPQRRHRSSDPLTGAQWFYELLGQVYGPLTSVELLSKVRSGEIAGNTPVRKDDSQWVNAEEVNGLFHAARQDKTQYRCPYCGGRINKPPTTCLSCDRDVSAAYRVRQSQATLPPSASQAIRPPADKSKQEGGVRTLFTWFKSLLDDGEYK